MKYKIQKNVFETVFAPFSKFMSQSSTLHVNIYPNNFSLQAMEKLAKAGKIKSLGLSNFNAQQLQDVLDNCEIKPVTNQIELNPYLQSDELVEFCKQNNIAVTCYGPIGCGQAHTQRPGLPTVLENETIIEIAKAHNKSPAQVCIRWSIQKGLVPLPKSVTPSRISQNIEVFDFSLTGEEMLKIKALGEVNYRFYAVER
jgi:diketogulonate reductase-like aldo/keto reductase